MAKVKFLDRAHKRTYWQPRRLAVELGLHRDCIITAL